MWASKKVRRQREKIIIEKHLCGWCVKDIASYIGINSGSVSFMIKAYKKQEVKDVPTTQE